MFDFSKFILKNAKAVKESCWSVWDQLQGNLSYGIEKHRKEIDLDSTYVHWHADNMMTIGLKIRSCR